MKIMVIICGLLFISICCSMVIVGLAQIYSTEINPTVDEGKAISFLEFISTTILFIYLFYDLLMR